MDNQHRKLDGYGELAQQQIDLMNEVAAIGTTLKELTERLGSFKDQRFAAAQQMSKSDLPIIDGRWFSIGVTDLQKGLMAVKRSIARPSGF